MKWTWLQQNPPVKLLSVARSAGWGGKTNLGHFFRVNHPGLRPPRGGHRVAQEVVHPFRWVFQLGGPSLVRWQQPSFAPSLVTACIGRALSISSREHTPHILHQRLIFPFWILALSF